jgi:hypothetical protein
MSLEKLDSSDICDVGKIHVNVGGTKYETTYETLKDCKGLIKYIGDKKNIFIDRDPIVFKKVLKFLRGYPVINEVLKDDDMVYELIYWKHKFIDIKLCECICKSIKIYDNYNSEKNSYIVKTLDFTDIDNPCNTDIDNSINTPNANHLKSFRSTHYLVPLKIASDMLKMSNFVRCEVVCTEGWDDHVWVEKEELKQLLYKLKLRILFSSSGKWCIC